MEKKTDRMFTAENEEIISYLKKSRLFSHMPDTQLERLSSYSDFIDYAPGDEIIREGEANNRIFFLIRGSLTVHAGGEFILRLSRKGDVVGEMSIIGEKLTSATVIAETPARLFSIQAAEIGKYTDTDAADYQNMLYRIFAMILTEKLSVTTHKARQYEIVNRRLIHRVELEKLISAISALFIDIDTSRIEETVKLAMEKLVSFYGYEQCCLCIQSDTDNPVGTLTGWRRDGNPSDPETVRKRWRNIQAAYNRLLENVFEGDSGLAMDPAAAFVVSAADESADSFICVPLLKRSLFAGVIAFSPSESIDEFEQEDTTMIAVAGELFRAVLGRKRVSEQLQQAYMAGMAENAVSMLHHIGNAITPAVTTVDQLITTNPGASIVEYLDRIYRTFSEKLEKRELEDYLDGDEKGSQMLPFFNRVLKELKQRDLKAASDLRSVETHLQQVSQIISLQQKYVGFRDRNETFHLSGVLYDIVEMMRPALSLNRIEIRQRIEPDLPRLTSAKNKLVQIFLNLLRNAVESIDEQRIINPDNEAVIDIQTFRSTDDSVVVAFTDTGVGLDPVELTRIFEFGYSSKTGGSGFGLHDCADYVRLCGGDIQITSPGKGSGARVEVTMPVSCRLLVK